MAMVPFIGPTYQHRSRNVGNARTVNLYPEVTEGGEMAKTNIVYIGTPGSETVVDLAEYTTYGCRGLHYTSTGRLFAAYGGVLVEIDSKHNVTKIADITDIPESPIYFADGANTLMWADGYVLRGYDLETNELFNPFVPIENYRPAQVVYLGSRFIMIDGESDTYYWCEVLKPRDWRNLNSAKANQSDDPIVSIKATQNELFLMGTQSYEVHRLTGNLNRPYQYAGGSTSNVGCGASRSVTVLNNTVMFLGGSVVGEGSVYASNGYNVTRISNHAIEYEIGQMSDTRDAIGFSYTQEGHQFYVLTFLTGDKTFVYDLTTQMWHERSTRDALLDIEHRWAPIYSVYAFGDIYTGNLQESKIMTLSLDKYNEWDSRPIVRLHQSPVYWDDLREMFHREFVIDMETGIGAVYGQGDDPQIMLQFSDDSGHTWSSESWTTIGKLGTYTSRCSWRRLGRSRARVYRVKISDPVKVVMIGARLIAEKGLRR